MKPRVLTLAEERDILLNGIGDYLDDGSSRRTHRLTTDCRDKYGFPCDCVVKIAKGIGGQRQNNLEINTFLDWDDAETFLANIFAFGRYIIIMEEVEVEDWSDLADNCEDIDMILEDCCQYSNESTSDYEDRYNKLEESCDKAAYTIDRLTTLFGTTSDNGQLGRTHDGRLVAYDYGFDTEKGCSFYCTKDSVARYCEQNFELYVEDLVALLTEEEDTLNAWEDKLAGDLHEEERLERIDRLPYSTRMPVHYIGVKLANMANSHYWGAQSRYDRLARDISRVKEALRMYLEDDYGFKVKDFEFMKRDNEDYILYNIEFDTSNDLWR